MARIVYGVSGEGSGHTSRALSVIPHLLQRGHTVKVVGYHRSYRDLKDRFDVFEIEGLSIGQTDSAVSITKTITENLSKVPRGHRKARELKAALFEQFKPEVVITDFEPVTAYLAMRYDIPLVTLDNQHRMRYMQLEVPARLVPGMQLTKNIIRAMIPRPDVSLVTTFHFSPVTNDCTFAFPPLIRPEIRDVVPRRCGHLVVYFTKGFEGFLKQLPEFTREEFRVYGQGKEGVEGNRVFKPFSRSGFIEDLATCKAVIASAGFTLLTECLHLGKPFLGLPIRGQFEQELNALLLDATGCGKGCLQPRAETVGDFLYRLPEYEAQLRSYPRESEGAILAKLDELLANDGALAREFHRKRTHRTD